MQANGDLDLAEGDDEADDVAVVEPANDEAADGRTLAGRKIPPIVSHWNLAEYLPASVRQVFLVGTTYYLECSRRISRRITNAALRGSFARSTHKAVE